MDRLDQWIYFSSRRFIFVNGSPTKEFLLQIRFHQGDPLSLYWFIITIDGLHVAIKDEVVGNIFQGNKVGINNLPISHLFYVDDVLLMRNSNIPKF